MVLLFLFEGKIDYYIYMSMELFLGCAIIRTLQVIIPVVWGCPLLQSYKINVQKMYLYIQQGSNIYWITYCHATAVDYMYIEVEW